MMQVGVSHQFTPAPGWAGLAQVTRGEEKLIASVQVVNHKTQAQWAGTEPVATIEAADAAVMSLKAEAREFAQRHDEKKAVLREATVRGIV